MARSGAAAGAVLGPSPLPGVPAAGSDGGQIRVAAPFQHGGTNDLPNINLHGKDGAGEAAGWRVHACIRPGRHLCHTNLGIEIARSTAVQERQEPVMRAFDSEVAGKPAMNSFESEIGETATWLAGPRFEGVTRLYSARQVAEQRGTIPADFTVARLAAEQFYDRLRQLFAERKQITTFGPYSPGQAVAIKRMGIEGIYLGGWATSARGSVTEDPGPDLASYPLSQVPDEAAPIVRALLTADRNQGFARSRMSAAQRAASSEVDYRPFIIADADTGHGGEAHVRNLIRRFVEVGVPGYHIEDQKPGAKKCGHQGGKVLVGVDEQIKR